MMSQSLTPTLLNSRRKQSGIFQLSCAIVGGVCGWVGGWVFIGLCVHMLLTEMKKKDKDLKHKTMEKIYSNASSYNIIEEKAMAPHSSTLGWKIPWIEEPGRLQSMGSLKVGHD